MVIGAVHWRAPDQKDEYLTQQKKKEDKEPPIPSQMPFIIIILATRT